MMLILIVIYIHISNGIINKLNFMGIKGLNTYLIKNCSNTAIRTIQLNKLSGTTIVVDVSTYLYRFEMNNMLIDKMTTFISKLLVHKIVPIIIFDGKTPHIKQYIVDKRHQTKKRAENQYNTLEKQLKDVTNNNIRKKIENDMCKFKRKSPRINAEKIANVKQLLDTFNVRYYNAIEEADEFCASMVLNGNAWGCLSEDTDMFAYGCSYVLRNLNINSSTVTLFDMDRILNELHMTQSIFREMCVISESDYIKTRVNISSSNEFIKQFNEIKNNNPQILFYDWVIHKLHNTVQKDKLIEIDSVFQLKQFKPIF